jgi:hypothetical protein
MRPVKIISLVALLFLAACKANDPNLHSQVISKRPAVWPQATLITCDCGAYQAQAALAARGMHEPIPKLYVSDWDRSQCSTLPWNFQPIFDQFGNIKTKTYYDFSDARFLRIVGRSLSQQRPLIVLIQATRGHHGLHWVSIWGYEAKTNDLLVYDSQYPTSKGGVGNTRYSVPMIESRFPWWLRTAIEIRN